MDLSKYKGKMGKLVDAGALLTAVESTGSMMKVPNVYIALGEKQELDLAHYFIGGENLTYTCSVADVTIASSTLVGTKLIVSGINIGTTKIVIKVSNGDLQTIIVTVRNNAGASGWM